MNGKHAAIPTDETHAQPQDQRPLVERTKDEIAAWFGDPDAAARRQRDSAVGDHTGKGPDSHLDPDARIVDEISHRLTEDPGIDATRVVVAAHDGAVTLDGQVSTSAARAHVEEVATTVAGVSRVENHLMVA
ncbi:MAG TPA: BON domain-containing protein [Caulobacteraceae bacterium]|jgi:osmotically-inducible protein OsmY|nr:BON domain-containing protein [Caulobacteraceae bacterium]